MLQAYRHDTERIQGISRTCCTLSQLWSGLPAKSSNSQFPPVIPFGKHGRRESNIGAWLPSTRASVLEIARGLEDGDVIDKSRFTLCINSIEHWFA